MSTNTTLIEKPAKLLHSINHTAVKLDRSRSTVFNLIRRGKLETVMYDWPVRSPVKQSARESAREYLLRRAK